MLFIVRGSLFDGRGLLFFGVCCLFIVRGDRCLLFVVCYVGVRCLSFVVNC